MKVIVSNIIVVAYSCQSNQSMLSIGTLILSNISTLSLV